MKSAIAIRHVAFEDLGSLASVLEQRNYKIRYVEAGTEDLGAIEPTSHDLMIFLGGPIGAYDEFDYAFLKDEFRLLEHRLANDLPTLGICLGAQLMARVLGAKVYPGDNGKEIGWLPISLSPEGHQSVLRPLARTEAVLHWHGDTFDLPKDCVHLAASNQYQNQAFAYQKNSLALQFHPEVTPRSLEQWLIGHANEINGTEGVSVARLREDTRRYGQELPTQAALCWQSWLEQIESPPNSQEDSLLVNSQAV